LVIDANACFNSATVNVIVNPLPIVTATGATVCINQTFSLSATGGVNYSWAGPNSYVSFQQNPIITNATTNMSGSYVVTVTDNKGCTNGNVAQVVVNPLPVITVSSAIICIGNSTVLNASGASTYSWSPAVGLSGSVGSSVTANPATTTSYTITGTDINTCVNTATTTVTVNPLPVLAVGPSASGCAPVCVSFINSTPVTGTCSWNFGDGSFSNSCTPNHCFVTPGTFKVTLTLTDGKGCVNSDSTKVIVFPQPIADFGFSPQPATNIDPVHFTDMSQGAVGPNSYGPYGMLWYLGDVFLANPANNYVNNSMNPMHLYDGTDAPYSYYVTQWVQNQFGCKDSITKVVEIKPSWTFYIPNAFSPNDDGVNEGFKGTGVGIDNTTYNLWIFDRWGMLLFYSNDLEKVWDGRIQGKDGDIVQEDTYVWKVRFHDFMGMSHEYRGIVSVIK